MNSISKYWFCENLQEVGYYGQRRSVWEEAGFINWLPARSEDMVSGATNCPPRSQDTKKTFISSSQSWKGDFNLREGWLRSTAENNLACPWGGVKWQKTSADDDRLNTMMGEEVERKIGLRENCCCQIGLPLIPWCKTNDKVAKFVWQNTHSLSDELDRSWCHITLWKVVFHKISRDVYSVWSDMYFVPWEGKLVWPPVFLFHQAYLI